MSRRYRCQFVSTAGDVATAVGHGNTRKVAERSARNLLPTNESGTVKWLLRSIEHMSPKEAA